MSRFNINLNKPEGMRNDAERFIAFVMTKAQLTQAEAEKVLLIYEKERVFARGTFEVKHGAFLEVDVLQRAARQKLDVEEVNEDADLDEADAAYAKAFGDEG